MSRMGRSIPVLLHGSDSPRAGLAPGERPGYSWGAQARGFYLLTLRPAVAQWLRQRTRPGSRGGGFESLFGQSTFSPPPPSLASGWWEQCLVLLPPSLSLVSGWWAQCLISPSLSLISGWRTQCLILLSLSLVSGWWTQCLVLPPSLSLVSGWWTQCLVLLSPLFSLRVVGSMSLVLQQPSNDPR